MAESQPASSLFLLSRSVTLESLFSRPENVAAAKNASGASLAKLSRENRTARRIRVRLMRPRRSPAIASRESG